MYINTLYFVILCFFEAAIDLYCYSSSFYYKNILKYNIGDEDGGSWNLNSVRLEERDLGLLLRKNDLLIHCE